MKTFAACFSRLVCAVLTISTARADRPLRPRPAAPPPEAMAWTPTPRSAHETSWKSVSLSTNPVTLKVHEVKHEYLEVAVGLNVPQPDGSFHRANPSLVITANGAEAQRTLHRLVLAPNINADGGSVQFTTGDGVTIRCSPLSFGYFDPVSGQCVILGVVTNAGGWLLSPDAVVYSNCFTGIRASLLYQNKLGGFSQNLVLHEQPLAPESYGLSPRSRLEMWTEFPSDVPVSAESVCTLSREENPAVRSLMAEPDFTDTTLLFSTMRMGEGRAFSADVSTPLVPASDLQAPVGKAIKTINGRTLLIEGAEYEKIKGAITNLPPAMIGPESASVLPQRVPPIRQMAGRSRWNFQRLAQNRSLLPQRREQFVLDFDISGNLPQDYVFKGDTTYHVTADTTLTGTTVIEGGAILKFASAASLIQSSGTIDCRTTNYHPAVFTCETDNTAGEVIATGTPATTSGKGLSISSGVSAYLHDLRFSFLGYGIFVSGGATKADFQNLQLVKCGKALGAQKSAFLGNALIEHPVTAALEAPSGVIITNVHVTVNTAPILCTSAGTGAARFTNCLLIQITATTSGSATCTGDHNGFNNGFSVGNTPTFGANTIGPLIPNTTTPYPYPLVGISAGSNYLDPRSVYKTQGTKDGVPQALLDEIHRRTTRMPALLTGTINGDTTLRPVPLEDAQEPLTPDLGYHYAKVDYLISGCQTYLNKFTLLDGVVVAMDFHLAGKNGSGYGWQTGLTLNGTDFLSQGTANRPNRIIRSYAFQEQPFAYSIGGFAQIFCFYSGTTSASLRLRFTDMALLSGPEYYISNPAFMNSTELSHSQFHGGNLLVRLYAAYGLSASTGWTNCLFERTKCDFQNYATGYAFLYNNTFYRGYLKLDSGGAGWSVRDNLFDTLSQLSEGFYAVDNAYNGYVNCPNTLSGTGPHRTLPSLTYDNGTLGRYYLPSSATTLIDGGSRPAGCSACSDYAGLYHFTTRNTQSKEVNSTVDIGYHSVAVDGNGKALDSDQDGVPLVPKADGLADYLEDVNGNGVKDGSETDWALYKSDGVKSDYQSFLENSMTPKPFVVTWSMRHNDVNKPQGVLIRGKSRTSPTDQTQYDDYSIQGNFLEGAHGSVWVYLDFVYNAARLANWNGHVDYDADSERGVRFFLPAPDGNFHQYAVVYDFHDLRVYVDGSIVSDTWLDNMTSHIGLDASHIPAVASANTGNNAEIDSASVFSSSYVVQETPPTWNGTVGNTSASQSGLSVHSGFWPITNMTWFGNYVAYTAGYHEGNYPVKLFKVNNVQQIVTNFCYAGNIHKKGDTSTTVYSLRADSTGIYVKFSPGNDTSDIQKWTYDSANDKWSYAGRTVSFPALNPPTFSPAVNNQLALTHWDRGASPNNNWAVYDGATEQVKIYNSAGNTLLQTIGIANGYSSGAPRSPDVTQPNAANFAANVKLGAYYYDKNPIDDLLPDVKITRTALTYQDDGKLWICDTVTGRAFRLDPANAYNVDAWFMYMPRTYCSSVDPNSPNTAKRVFNQFVEFEVDQSNPALASSWTVKKYWGNLDVNGNPVQRHSIQSGLFSITTFPNSTKTFALTSDADNPGSVLRFVELTSTGLRYTTRNDLRNLNANTRLEADGSMLYVEKVQNTSDAIFHRKYLNSTTLFDVSGDPNYLTENLGTVTLNETDPVDYNFALTADKIIVYHPDRNHLGYHLGALSRTSPPQWQWRTCKNGPLNGKGAFDSWCEYGGADFKVVGSSVLCIFKGEFWKSAGQANQIFQFSTDGIFVRQIGMPVLVGGGEVLNVAGSAANMFTISASQSGSSIYVYVNDEGGRGVHRWTLSQ